MTRRKETITLSIPAGTKEKLEAIARHLNIFWGKSPSPSGLITAIAQQELEIGVPFRFNSLQLQSLQQAVKALIDTGYVGDAQTLIELLLERGNLEAPLRQSLLKQISQPTENWRKILDRQIENCQPFILLYHNAQEIQETFTIRSARMRFYEKRFYLEAWCEETAESQEIPQLIHNRCFRLDRILSILPVSKDWYKTPDYLKVQLQFKGWLVKAYESKPDDLEDREINGIRQVIRNVSNSFWLIRELLAYGEDCNIVSPESVRDRFKQKLQRMNQQYEFC